MGPNLFARNENIAHAMPHGTACAMTSCVHRAHAHTGKPATLCICGMPGITYGRAIRAGQRYLSKITASHYSTLNMDFANWNVLKRILIAMLNENKADWNENFRICAEEPVAPLYKR